MSKNVQKTYLQRYCKSRREFEQRRSAEKLYYLQEHLFHLFKRMGLDHKQFGFHNLRSRDARAMTNLRISNRQCISDKVVIGYLKSKGNVNQTK